MSVVKQTIKNDVMSRGFVTREVSSSTLQIVFSPRASFSQIDVCFKICKRVAANTGEKIEISLSALRSDVVVSVRVGSKRPLEEDVGSATSSARAASPHTWSEDYYCKRVNESIEKIHNAVKGTENEDKLEKASEILYRFERLSSLDGGAERAVQSFGLFVKKLRSSDVPSIMLAIRVNTATPVKGTDVQKMLGVSWKDGMFTTETGVEGVDGFKLPLSEEAELSLKHGNKPLLIMTTVS